MEQKRGKAEAGRQGGKEAGKQRGRVYKVRLFAATFPGVMGL